MARWLFWICYINPVFYAFQALLVNELSRIDLQCALGAITPGGPNHPPGVGPNQVCAVAGASPGSAVVPGSDYLAAAFGYYKSNVGRDIGILIAFLIGLIAVTCFVMETRRNEAFYPPLNIVKTPNGEEKQLNDRLKERRLAGSDKVSAGHIVVS
jgi:ATP-binding cassette, subfamily G (WHITE), member 2, SNQ2